MKAPVSSVDSPANDPATEHAVDTKTEVGASIPVSVSRT